MKKLILLLLLIFFVVAYFTKPDDKTCKIEGVRAVWGDLMPDVNKSPAMFEEFMNLHSPSVDVKNWVFFKQIKYRVNEKEKTVAYAAFKNVIPTVQPVELNKHIPAMPGSRK